MCDVCIEVCLSGDRLKWSCSVGCRKGLALEKDDVWVYIWFWAPGVYSVNGRYYMYFIADEHINVAVSDSPLGPFVQEEHAPMLETKAIDNHHFFDDDGTPYSYFVNFKDGLEVWMAEISTDLLSIKKEIKNFCIRPHKPWRWDERREGTECVNTW